LLKIIRGNNRIRKRRKPLSKGFRKRLANYYEKDIKKLGRLIDRDLSSWLNGGRCKM
jgi:hypothetical protein